MDRKNSESYIFAELFLELSTVLIIFVPTLIFTVLKVMLTKSSSCSKCSQKDPMEQRKAEMERVLEEKSKEIINYLEDTSYEFSKSLVLNVEKIKSYLQERINEKLSYYDLPMNISKSTERIPLYRHQTDEKLKSIKDNVHDNLNQIKRIYLVNIDKIKTDLSNQINQIQVGQRVFRQNPNEALRLLPQNIEEITEKVKGLIGNIKKDLDQSKDELDRILPGIVERNKPFVILEDDIIINFNINLTEIALLLQEHAMEIAKRLLQCGKNII